MYLFLTLPNVTNDTTGRFLVLLWSQVVGELCFFIIDGENSIRTSRSNQSCYRKYAKPPSPLASITHELP